MSKEAIEHYEAALKEAFPRGATGEVFHHWNEARYLIANEAMDKMAENARELGLDYDAKSDHRLMEQPAQQEPYPLEEMQEEILRLSEIISTNAFYQAGHANALEWAAEMAVLEDPRTSDWVYDDPHELAKVLRKGPDFGPTTPPAQRTWVGLTEQEAAECWSTSTVRTWQAIEAKLKEKNT